MDRYTYGNILPNINLQKAATEQRAVIIHVSNNQFNFDDLSSHPIDIVVQGNLKNKIKF